MNPPLISGESDNYPIENDPWGAYYAHDFTPLARMTLLVSTQSIYATIHPESQKANIWQG